MATVPFSLSFIHRQRSLGCLVLWLSVEPIPTGQPYPGAQQSEFDDS